MKLIQTLFLLFVFLSSCEGNKLNVRLDEADALQNYNLLFHNVNSELYKAIERHRYTIQAQGGGQLNCDIYYSLQMFCGDFYFFLAETRSLLVGNKKRNPIANEIVVIPDRDGFEPSKRKEWPLEDFRNSLNHLYTNLIEIPKNDSLYQRIKKSSLINFEKYFSADSLKNELQELKIASIKRLSEVGENPRLIDLLDFLNLVTSTVLIAERKVLRFLNEYYMKVNLLDESYKIELAISSNKTTYSPGEEVILEVYPTFRNSPKLFAKNYRVLGAGIDSSFLIKGSFFHVVDSIWLPTSRIGDFTVSGSAQNALRQTQIHDFQYNYKVVLHE